jgi:hypothetical protein
MKLDLVSAHPPNRQKRAQAADNTEDGFRRTLLIVRNEMKIKELKKWWAEGERGAKVAKGGHPSVMAENGCNGLIRNEMPKRNGIHNGEVCEKKVEWRVGGADKGAGFGWRRGCAGKSWEDHVTW